VGVLLRQAREEAELTQEQLAARLETKKSAISRIENHAGDIRLSTLERYAKALGRQLSLELRPARGAAARSNECVKAIEGHPWFRLDLVHSQRLAPFTGGGAGPRRLPLCGVASIR
jgi:transcriptional regulator with XRE-family HTH domain